MERSRAAMWTYLLGAGLALAVSTTTSKTAPRAPRLIRCVFINRANVTCRWAAGDAPATRYTLRVLKKSGTEPPTSNSYLEAFACSTSHTSCTADLSRSSVRFPFCVVVTAHTRGGNISSAPRCQSGRIEVMLPPVSLSRVKSVSARPRCLSLSWSRTLSEFPVSTSEIQTGILKSQINLTAEGQRGYQTKNVTVTNFTFVACVFRPATSYAIRLRHRYMGAESPWSPWSNEQQGATGEEGPSAAPAFWRRLKRSAENGWRRVSLLWKPLPRVLFYNVTCQTESTRVLSDYGSCTDLRHTTTSCSLLLPDGRCSCALTASNSAGTSPEARVWLLGSSESEPPSSSQITANPLDDSNLDVRWTDPGDRSVSGFVLEWFAVRQDNSSVLHWERVNRSCTALVITEGIKPMELYAVSVTALHAERGPGKNRTLYMYTVQGAPSAGPVVKVQRIFGSTVELTWSPVAVELLHGFVRNYTLCYSTTNRPARSVFVPGHAHGYSLKRLSPGNYAIFMWANTDAGGGAAGPIINVHIDSEEISVVVYATLPLIITSLVLVLMACLAQNNKVKRKLCQDVPNPSHSSLASWTPKTALKGMNHSVVPEKSEIKYCEVFFLGESEVQTYDSDEEISCNLQTYSTHLCSPVPVLRSPTQPNCQNTKLSELFMRSSTRDETIPGVDLSPCSYIYSNVLTSQTLMPYLPPSYCHAVSFNGIQMQPGGGDEPPEQSSESTLSPTDELKTFGLSLKPHQTPLASSDNSCISQSTTALSRPAEIASFSQAFPQGDFNSIPSLQPDAPSNKVSTPFSPFHPLVFVDMSYRPVKREPYTSLAV